MNNVKTISLREYSELNASIKDVTIFESFKEVNKTIAKYLNQGYSIKLVNAIVAGNNIIDSDIECYMPGNHEIRAILSRDNEDPIVYSWTIKTLEPKHKDGRPLYPIMTITASDKVFVLTSKVIKIRNPYSTATKLFIKISDIVACTVSFAYNVPYIVLAIKDSDAVEGYGTVCGAVRLLTLVGEQTLKIYENIRAIHNEEAWHNKSSFRYYADTSFFVIAPHNQKYSDVLIDQYPIEEVSLVNNILKCGEAFILKLTNEAEVNYVKSVLNKAKVANEIKAAITLLESHGYKVEDNG